MIADLKPYLEYRETGSLWLGKVPAHWGVHSLRTLIKSRNERNRPDLPLLSVAREKGVFVRSLAGDDDNHNVIPDDLSNYKVARAGNLVINKMKAWQGSMGVAPCDGVVSPAYYVFDFDMKNTDYGQALLRSKPYVAHFGQASDGVRVGQWDLSIPGMRQIPVVIPPPDEQAAIVRFLNYANLRIEKAIRAKRKVIALLNEQMQVIIHRAVTRGVDPNVKLKPSEIPWLGDIPEGWKVNRLGRLTTKIGDGLHGTPMYVEQSPYHFINGNNLVKGSIQIKSSTRCVALDEYNNHKITLDDSTILMSINGTIGSVAYYRWEPIMLGKSAAYINCGKYLSRSYLFYFMQSPVVINLLHQEVTGTTIFNLSLASIRRLLIPYPSVDEQNKIVHFIEEATSPVNRGINRTEREIDLLREYRTRLIADVVTGKLDVREAAARLPDELEELATLQDCGETAELNDNGLDAEDES
jgi:type I restriction enzyme, S subunit